MNLIIQKDVVMSGHKNNSENKKAQGRLLIICTALLWGLAGICVKSITWNSMSIVTVRCFISLIMLFIFKRSLKLKITKANLLGGLAMSVTGIMYIMAIKLTTAGTAIVLQYSAPILVFLYAVIFKGRKAKAAEVILTFCVFAGCVLSFAGSLDFTHVLGNLIALGSGFTYAVQIIIMNSNACDSLDTSIISNIICIIICLPFMLADNLVFDVNNIVWLLIIGVFQYGLPNILFSRGIKLTDSVEASLLLTIEPVFNPIPVAIFCGEYMDAPAIAGSVIVIISIALYTLLPRLRTAD